MFLSESKTETWEKARKSCRSLAYQRFLTSPRVLATSHMCTTEHKDIVNAVITVEPAVQRYSRESEAFGSSF